MPDREHRGGSGRSCALHCLKLENISVASGGEALLRDVSLHAHCGELTAIIGRNGAGKTTLLRALLGEVRHTGAIRFSGHGGEPSGRPAVGYVPQSIHLDASSPATVYDLLMSFSSSWPVFLPRRRRDTRRLREHLEAFHAGGLLDKPAGRLSGGELQRVLLAAAMLSPAGPDGNKRTPDLLILDEPVAGVDQAGLVMFYALLDELRRKADLVMLLVSHDLAFVREHADRVLLLDREVLACGPPAAVFGCAAFRAAFPAWKEAAS